MKSFKKIFFVIILSVVTIISVACSASVSNDAVLTKFYENTKNIKSVDVKSTAEITITPEEERQTVTTKTLVDETLFLDPLSIKRDISIESSGRNIDISMYFKDDIVYIKSIIIGDGENWIKTPDKGLIEQLPFSKKGLGSSSKVLEIFKNKIDGIEIEEKNGVYEISFSGNIETIKDIAFDWFEQSAGNNPIAKKNRNDMSFKVFNIKYIVDKDTYLPLSLYGEVEIYINSSGEKGTIKTIISEKYENINNVSELVLPDEVRNAKNFGEQ